MIEEPPGPEFVPVSYQGAIGLMDAEFERFAREATDLMIREGATPAQLAKGLAQLAVILCKMRERGIVEIDKAFARLQGPLH
jgi:hypothetical protein